MTTSPPTLDKLQPNPEWAKLPLFDRTGWTRVRFGDVVENVNDTVRGPQEAGIERFIAMEHLEPGSLHIREWGTVADGITFTRRCRPGQVLFGKRRAYQRKVAVAEFDALVSGDIYVLAPKGDRLLLELLPFLCLTERFFQHAVGTSAGSLSPRTNWNSLAGFELTLPPLDQQRRLAEILWAMDEELNSFLGVRNGLEASGRALFGKDLSRFGAKPLSEVADFLDGRRVPLSEKDRAKRKGPYPYYGASGVIDSVDDYLFDEPLVLLSEDGFNLVNRTSRIAFKVEGKVWVNNHAHVLRPRVGMNVDFLANCLESVSLEPYITGTYQRKLNKSECERIPIPFPPPGVQDDIGSTIRRISMSVSAVEGHVAVCRDLASALLTRISEVDPVRSGGPNATAWVTPDAVQDSGGAKLTAICGEAGSQRL